MHQLKKRALLITAGALLLTACSDNPAGPDGNESDIVVKTIEDLYAPADRDSEEHEYVLFSLKTGEIVPAASAGAANWDIGFASTDIILNSGIHGEGDAAAVVLDVPFEEVEIAPANGYATDTEEGNAIQGWYHYTEATGTPMHAILAREDVTIVIKTADGSYYGKIHVQSYYQGSPDPGSEEFANLQTRPPSQYYTFRYALQQTEGARELK